MKKSEKKEYIFNRLNEVLKPKRYYLVKTGLDPRYILDEEERAISFIFNFKDIGQIAFSKVYISIKVVENIIIEIKRPSNQYDFVDNKKYFLQTLVDNYTPMPEDYYNGIGYMVETQEQLEFFTNWMINYLQTDGQEFIDTYSYLPNVLAKMDELTNEGKTWQNRENGILAGSLDAQFRGLIIAKLCNDPNFEDKIKMCDDIFSDETRKEWLPYYEKLKERLVTVEPIYNR